MGLRNRQLFKDEKCFFVTTSCIKWKRLIQFSNSYDTIVKSLIFVNQKYDAVVLGYVIMPNHIHIILYFKHQNRLSSYMRDFKKYTSTRIRQNLDQYKRNAILESIRSDKKNRAFQVWHDRFDDVYLADPRHLEIKLEYIHTNPLQEHWGLTDQPEKYPFSSAQFYETGIQNSLKVEHYSKYFE